MSDHFVIMTKDGRFVESYPLPPTLGYTGLLYDTFEEARSDACPKDGEYIARVHVRLEILEEYNIKESVDE